MESLRAKLVREMRGKMIHNEISDFQAGKNISTDEEANRFQSLSRIVDWMAELFYHVNRYLERRENDNSAVSSQNPPQAHFIGPTIFISCPLDEPRSARTWFINLWNYSLFPCIQNAVKDQAHHSHNDTTNQSCNITDPTEWILKTWPWPESPLIMNNQVNFAGSSGTSAVCSASPNSLLMKLHAEDLSGGPVLGVERQSAPVTDSSEHRGSS